MNVPYFSQWESRDLVEAFISGKEKAENDPLWQASGAKTPKEYATWAKHICGMACLKMIVANKFGKTVPLIELARSCRKHGGYKKLPMQEIKGLYYKPFVDFVIQGFGLSAEVCVDFPVEQVRDAVNKGGFFMASVHPSIRKPEEIPPAKGGHLILLFRNERHPEKLMFHNPSGFTKNTQENVEMEIGVFNSFYVSRGIFVNA